MLAHSTQRQVLHATALVPLLHTKPTMKIAMTTPIISHEPVATTRDHRSTSSLSSTGPTFDRVVSFGSSSTDTGNVYALTKGAWPRPAYFNGRFSNGPTWVEYLVPLVGAHELRDFAYGGATTDNTLVQGWTGAEGDVAVPSVMDQIRMFASEEGKEKVGRTLYAVWVGNNDFYYTNATVDPDLVTDNILRAVQTLDELHAVNDLTPNHHTLVMGMVNWDHTPYFVAQPAEVRNAFQAAANSYNASLASKIEQYTNTASTRRATFVPTAHIVPAIYADPEAVGFPRDTDGTPWLDVPDADPDAQVYFDQFHVTTKVHALFAQAAAAALAGTARGVEKNAS
ncbi:hypothetical protein AMAG_14280 [Allomyces macrogynus ATCC 38327]|uniref:SGNH hydrolase-type esterase domain-containing protein n=1 Tax=Allomyces macrogynus (strain ATCC 38327) TaxID=578462 RepID=A0A0L0T4J2_ALLM3|nr:hypothetical protein AMAG_14280 [Allomyces macrogynus ATCC 38327]|eukprot:KNE69738.1 hypothetical protein AMAG_14280 [Allomyces macrogynus ATCC 38327]